MSAPVFVDTGYVLALVNSVDPWHDAARDAALATRPPFVTTEAVLVEIGNTLARTHWRHLGIATLHDLRSDPEIEVVPVDSDLFARGLVLYSTRADKEWGLTDSISFAVMQERGLTEALTTDRHFEQAGFRSLLVPLTGPQPTISPGHLSRAQSQTSGVQENPKVDPGGLCL